MSARRDLIADTVPVGLLKVLDEIVAELARELGESPEAWRGARAVAQNQAQVLRIALEADNVDPSKLLTVHTLVAALLIEHPLGLVAGPYR